MEDNLKALLDQINEMMQEFNEQAQKRVEKGNASAGMRSRKASSAIAKLMKDWRAESVKKD